MQENIICGKTLSEIEELKEKHEALVLIEVKECNRTYGTALV